MKSLYEITKTWLSNGKPRNAASVKDKQGNTITDDEGRKEPWKEHFEEILNKDIPTNPLEITEENYPEIETININPITKDEVNCAIRKLQNGKAGGVDMITPELLKSDIQTSTNKLHSIISDIWNQQKIPCELVKTHILLGIVEKTSFLC